MNTPMLERTAHFEEIYRERFGGTFSDFKR